MKRFFLSALTGLVIVSSALAGSLFAPMGVGMTERHETARSASLAGSDVVLSDSLYFPIDNPAGWFNVGYTRYSASMRSVKINASDAVGSETSDDFTFPAMAFSMPIYRSLGMGFAYEGLTDHEFLVYRYETISPVGSDSTYDVTRRVQGSGGLARVTTNFGARVRPWLAVGVGMDYYFGKTERLWTLDFDNGNFARSGEFRRNEYSGLGFRLAAIGYMSSHLQVTGVLELPTTLRVRSSLTIQGGDSLSLGRTDFGLPLGGTVGAAWTKNRVRFTGAATIQQWGETSRDIGANDPYTTAYDIRLGAARLPLRGPLDPWYQKWVYRAGIRTSQHYLDINGNPMRTLGFSLGLGISFKTHLGIFDIALTYDIRGSEADNGAMERIIGVQIGFASAEKWFVRRKR